MVKNGIVVEPDPLDSMSPEQMRALIREEREQIEDNADEFVRLKRGITQLPCGIMSSIRGAAHENIELEDD